MKEIDIWIERLSSLQKSQMRKATTEAGIPLVHFEILQYLSICNRYSNTAQALSEYFGQTKSSISQSLKLIEKAGHIERKPCEQDKRAVRIHLTPAGMNCYAGIAEQLLHCEEDDPQTIEVIKSLLVRWQKNNQLHVFGQCKSCRYNQIIEQKAGVTQYLCGLTGEALSGEDVEKICKEHEFIAVENLP